MDNDGIRFADGLDIFEYKHVIAGKKQCIASISPQLTIDN
jgi:hypothetical protein